MSAAYAAERRALPASCHAPPVAHLVLVRPHAALPFTLFNPMRTIPLALCCFLVSVTPLVAEDEAVRAFLGIRASHVDLETPTKPMFYATTFAKFQNGQFIGFGHLGTGMNQPESSRRYVEVAWGTNAGAVGYVFIDPFGSSSFTADPFFEQLTVTMSGKPLPMHPQFRGFEAVGYALSKDAQQSSSKLFLTKDIEHELQGCDHAIVILYREFEKQEDYSKFISEFKKSNTQ